MRDTQQFLQDFRRHIWMHTAVEGKVRTMYIMGENPMLSDPNITQVEAALRVLDFAVCLAQPRVGAHGKTLPPSAPRPAGTEGERRMDMHRSRMELQAQHTPSAIATRLAAHKPHSYVGDAVLGAIDGGVTTFAVVSGVLGPTSPRVLPWYWAWPIYAPTDLAWP
jgi:hypothetical protein